jgi:hypothetical protein
MQNGNLFGLFLATLVSRDFHQIQEELRPILEEVGPTITAVVMAFLTRPVSPQTTFELEKDLDRQLREIGRQVLEMLLNRLEPDDPQSLPKHFSYQQQQYSRKEEKSQSRGGIGTCFGTINLRRFSCEPLQEAREDGQKSFAPLELLLGIVAGNATPALAERVAHLAVGHTQQELLRRLAEDHGVVWSVAVLRQVTAAVSTGMAPHLHQAQKVQLLEWLRQADGSKGRRPIVLAVGRDGIMLPIRGEKTYKEGAVATIAVYDRRGRRRGTVYLGQMPEAYQTTLSDQLTRLLTEVLGEWSGCWPRLVYVTDAGYHPTDYFDKVLDSLDDPRRPGRRLRWVRVVDFYHACEYLADLASALFKEVRASHAWLKRMTHWLKHEWRAVFRILHSAAKHRSQRVLSAATEEIYEKAYNYLSAHQEFMDYREYRRYGLPIGSGVTEAACKTVFTQRFKASGMTWNLEGGQTILVLRLTELSGVWSTVYRNFLRSRPTAISITKPINPGFAYAKAA